MPAKCIPNCGKCCYFKDSKFIRIPQKYYKFMISNGAKKDNFILIKKGFYGFKLNKKAVFDKGTEQFIPRTQLKGEVYYACPFLDLDTKLCKIHKIRPFLCRFYFCYEAQMYSEELKEALLKPKDLKNMNLNSKVKRIRNLYIKTIWYKIMPKRLIKEFLKEKQKLKKILLRDEYIKILWNEKRTFFIDAELPNKGLGNVIKKTFPNIKILWDIYPSWDPLNPEALKKCKSQLKYILKNSKSTKKNLVIYEKYRNLLKIANEIGRKIK